MSDDIGELLDWLGKGAAEGRIPNPDERARWSRAVNRESAEASRWRVIGELLSRGYHRHEWNYNTDTEELSFECYDKRVTGEDTDDCLEKMIEATNE
jgi:hypothetical protein